MCIGTDRKLEQAEEVGAIRVVSVADEQLIQARPEDEHDRSNKKHVWNIVQSDESSQMARI
jgi:hypothetical protein